MKTGLISALVPLSLAVACSGAAGGSTTCAIRNADAQARDFSLSFDAERNLAHLTGQLEISAGNKVALQPLVPQRESTVYAMELVVSDGLPPGLSAPAVMMSVAVAESFSVPPGYHSVEIALNYHGTQINSISCPLTRP